MRPTSKVVKEYLSNGILHREDGPAIIYSDGTKKWFFQGQLHRKGGPAIEYPDGTCEWYVNGCCYSLWSHSIPQNYSSYQPFLSPHSSFDPKWIYISISMVLLLSIIIYLNIGRYSVITAILNPDPTTNPREDSGLGHDGEQGALIESKTVEDTPDTFSTRIPETKEGSTPAFPPGGEETGTPPTTATSPSDQVDLESGPDGGRVPPVEYSTTGDLSEALNVGTPDKEGSSNPTLPLETAQARDPFPMTSPLPDQDDDRFGPDDDPGPPVGAQTAGRMPNSSSGGTPDMDGSSTQTLLPGAEETGTPGTTATPSSDQVDLESGPDGGRVPSVGSQTASDIPDAPTATNSDMKGTQAILPPMGDGDSSEGIITTFSETDKNKGKKELKKKVFTILAIPRKEDRIKPFKKLREEVGEEDLYNTILDIRNSHDEPEIRRVAKETIELLEKLDILKTISKMPCDHRESLKYHPCPK